MKIVGHIDFSDQENLKIIRAALAKHIDLTRQEPGCISFEVTENPDITGRFEVVEEFESKKAFEEHQVRTENSAWAEISKNGKRAYTKQ